MKHPILNQQIRLVILRLGIYGEGIGEWEGWTVFVDGVLPGEEVTAAISEVRKNFLRARLITSHQTSPHRVKPPCPVFGRCGGCQLMHLSYEEQLKTKQQRVIDALERIGKINVSVEPCVPSPQELAYRNKIQLPVIDNQMGLYAFRSHDLVEINQCYIHCGLGEKAFRLVKRLLGQFPKVHLRHVLIKTSVKKGQVLVVLVTEGKGDPEIAFLAQEILQGLPEIKGVVQNLNSSPGNVILSKNYQTLAGQPFLEDELCGLTFKVSPASFFQVNPPQAENLYLKTLEFCELTGTEKVLDAYCGVGTLALILAPHAKEVIGVEQVGEAITDAQDNAKRNGISNTKFHCAQAEEFISSLSDLDVAVLNPPRKGCDPAFLDQLAAIKPHRIVYVSCDPATLARDLATLQGKGYQVDTAVPFDMFPQTVHVETVVRLTRRP